MHGDCRVTGAGAGSKYSTHAALGRYERSNPPNRSRNSGIQWPVKYDSDIVERINYTPYGVGEHHPGSDVDGDHDADVNDVLAIQAASGKTIGTAGYNVEHDLDRSGSVNIFDVIAIVLQAKIPDGWISVGGLNDIGYDGYVFNPEIETYHVRFRWYDPEIGRWLERDPIGYIDGMGLYEYVECQSTRWFDPYGLTPESDAWDRSGYREYLEKSLDYWLTFLGAREVIDGRRTPVSPECKEKLRCILLAISWVESRHGTGLGNHPDRDPMQVAHPDDDAHKYITNTGKTKNHRGPVREGTLASVPHYKDLPNRTNRPYPTEGHRTSQFSPDDSFFWGTLWYFMRTNQTDETIRPRSAWNFGDCSWDRLIDGAERYNGDGDADYKKKIITALEQSGCKDNDCEDQ